MEDDRDQILLVRFQRSSGYGWNTIARVEVENFGVGIGYTWVSEPTCELDLDLFEHDEAMGVWRIDNKEFDRVDISHWGHLENSRDT